MISGSSVVRQQSLFLSCILVAVLSIPIYSAESAAELIQTVKLAPGVYFTPEAYSYYSRTGQTIPPQPPRETVVKAYRAALTLGKMGREAQHYIRDFIDLYPKVIHVTEIRNATYSGEGTFEDWLMTYLTSEKNKFLLSSPVLDYNSMVVCKPYIEVNHQVDFISKKSNAAGIIDTAETNITVTFNMYIGTCVLASITGMNLGFEQQNWKNWFAQNNDIIQSVPETAVVPARIDNTTRAGGVTFSEILVKGTYKMILTTGDVLTGVVEQKTDTTVIIETTEGKAYTFRRSLIRQLELVERPHVELSVGTDNTKLTQLTFDELRQTGINNLEIEITVAGGASFKGKLDFIDESMLKINVEGSKIPITREAIRGVTLIPPKAKNDQSNSAQQTKITKPQDTLVIKNREMDEWGKPKPDFFYSGIIQSSDDKSITIKMSDGTVKSFNRTEIIRVITHTQDNSNETISRYAKPLFCPDGMFLVDMPPGKQGKPFFRVCVDRYEFPNKAETVPTTNMSFMDAKKECESQGKRLCTAEEWEWACSGMEGYTYAYGWNRDDNTCNTESNRRIEPSGARHNCVSKFGGYDMTGNIFEWVVGSTAEPVLMGGPYSKCQTVSPGLDGSAKPQTGFRCCKSN